VTQREFEAILPTKPTETTSATGMKSLRSILAALFTGAAASASDQPNPSPKPSAEMMRELRLQWLTRKPTSESPAQKDEVAAVLMDWPIEEATVTVLASSVGDASVYTTGTFGIMGGISHEGAQKAALSFVECAKRHLSLSSPTTDYSYPDHQHVRFFFVTDTGVRTVSFAVPEVQKAGTEAYDLYAHGQAVLTEMRQITQIQRGY